MAEDLLLEVGAEELPASFVAPALEDLQRLVTEKVAAARLAHGEVRTYGTPRRLALLIKGVAAGSPDAARQVQGPSVKAAFGADGKPTQAAEKFAAGQGLTVDKLSRVSTPKGEYLAAQVTDKGRPASQLLPEILQAAVHGIAFKKSMRWGDVEQSFGRPVHWIVALLGREVLPVVFADVKSGRVTRGHRFANPKAQNPAIELTEPGEYVEKLKKAHVVADIAERKVQLHEALRRAAKEAGGQLLEDPDLLDQVTELIEQPTIVLGGFDPKHLDLPPEVLVQEMRTHQRYFSLVDAKGKLLPKFIAVSNTPVDTALSARGYEWVLKARLADGRFFFDEDRKTPLAARVEKLERVVFQQKLGSYGEKVRRVGALAGHLARSVGFKDLSTLERAAQLCKADLVTGMVGEFPELQGVMGREYARASKEPEEVALAISEHYLPRGATDALPTRDAGALLGIADRLDSLCGIFAIGKPPTGAADPFGLRRASLSIIRIVLDRGYRFRLGAEVDQALNLLEAKVTDVKRKPGEPPVREQVLDFFRGRLKAMWGEKERADVVEAVLAAGFEDLVAARRRLDALSRQVAGADFAPLAAAFKRVANIVEKQAKDVKPGPVNAGLLSDPAEKALHAATEGVRRKVEGLVGSDDYSGALKELSTLKPAVDAFFDKVMVMAEDPKVRENRIRLLLDIAGMFNAVADFASLQVEI